MIPETNPLGNFPCSLSFKVVTKFVCGLVIFVTAIVPRSKIRAFLKMNTCDHSRECILLEGGGGEVNRWRKMILDIGSKLHSGLGSRKKTIKNG